MNSLVKVGVSTFTSPNLSNGLFLSLFEGGKSYWFATDTEEEMIDWSSSLRTAIDQILHPIHSEKFTPQQIKVLSDFFLSHSSSVTPTNKEIGDLRKELGHLGKKGDRITAESIRKWLSTAHVILSDHNSQRDTRDRREKDATPRRSRIISPEEIKSIRASFMERRTDRVTRTLDRATSSVAADMNVWNLFDPELGNGVEAEKEREGGEKEPCRGGDERERGEGGGREDGSRTQRFYQRGHREIPMPSPQRPFPSVTLNPPGSDVTPNPTESESHGHSFFSFFSPPTASPSHDAIPAFRNRTSSLSITSISHSTSSSSSSSSSSSASLTSPVSPICPVNAHASVVLPTAAPANPVPGPTSIPPLSLSLSSPRVYFPPSATSPSSEISISSSSTSSSSTSSSSTSSSSASMSHEFRSTRSTSSSQESDLKKILSQKGGGDPMVDRFRNIMDSFLAKLGKLGRGGSNNWAVLFHQRMLATGKALDPNEIRHLLDLLDAFLRVTSDESESERSSKSHRRTNSTRDDPMILTASNLKHYIDTHRTDLENSLIGITPHPQLLLELRSSRNLLGVRSGKELLEIQHGKFALNSIVVVNVPFDPFSAKYLATQAFVCPENRPADEWVHFFFGRIADVKLVGPNPKVDVFYTFDECHIISDIPLLRVFPVMEAVAAAADRKDLVDDPLENFFETLRTGVTQRCRRFFSDLNIDEDLIHRSIFDPSLESILLLIKYRSILEDLFLEYLDEKPDSKQAIGSDDEREGNKNWKIGVTGVAGSRLGRFFSDVTIWIRSQIAIFEATTNIYHIYPLTRMTLKLQLSRSQEQFSELAVVTVRSIADTLNAVMDQIELDKHNVLTGLRKEEMTSWWLALIEEKVEKFLVDQGYDITAVPYDYITEEPTDTHAILRNLEILREQFKFLQFDKMENPAEVRPVHALIHELKGEIIPKIESFVRSARMVLCYYLSVSSSPSSVQNSTPLSSSTGSLPSLSVTSTSEIFMTHLKEKASHFDSVLYELLEELIKDLDYLEEMLDLENPSNRDNGEGCGGFTLGVVPVSGIIVGKFYRFENECLTCLQVWDEALYDKWNSLPSLSSASPTSSAPFSLSPSPVLISQPRTPVSSLPTFNLDLAPAKIVDRDSISPKEEIAEKKRGMKRPINSNKEPFAQIGQNFLSLE